MFEPWTARLVSVLSAYLAIASGLDGNKFSLAWCGEAPAEEISKWIEGLGSERYEEREEAMQRLKKAGNSASAALTQALSGSDLETRLRIKHILVEVEDKPLCAKLEVLLDRRIWRGGPMNLAAVLSEQEWEETKVRIKKDAIEQNEGIERKLKSLEAGADGSSKEFLERIHRANEEDLKTLAALDKRIDFSRERVAILVNNYTLAESIKLEPEADRWILQVASRMLNATPNLVIVKFPKSEKPVKFDRIEGSGGFE